MRKTIIATVVATFVLTLGFGVVAFAKDVTAKGTIAVVEDEGKQLTIKPEAGENLVCKFSSKRSKIEGGSKKDVVVGKSVTVLYDDENPAKEIKTLTLNP